MDKITFKVTGVTPLLMHNGRLANPFDQHAIAIKTITSKRKKTEDDQLSLFWLEWQGGLYWDEETGPYIPGANLESFLNDGARVHRRGQDILRGVIMLEDKAKLSCNWPKKKELRAIFDSGEFNDVRGVVNPSTSGRTMRCRPIFKEWSCEATFSFDPEVVSRDDMILFAGVAGKRAGLCDGKPKYGRCTVEPI